MITKRTVVSTCFILILLALAFLFNMPKASSPSKPSNGAVLVETASVRKSLIADQYRTIGNLESIDRIEISSEMPGQISIIAFKPGNKVKKGTLLIQLDDTVSQSELASAKANLKLSKMNFERTSKLAKRRLASTQALDQALADLHEKENLVKVKKAQVEKLSLRAPFTGVLGSKKISIGQYVNVGQPLVSLVANHKLKVEYQIPEQYVSLLKKGQKISVISDAFPDKPYQGVVSYISPSINKDTRTINVEALIDNQKQHLYSGLFVRITHQFGEEKKRLLVPEESIIPTISGQKIYVIRNNKAKALKVVTGVHHADMIEVKKGLTENDTVIIRGQHKLKDGSLVMNSNQA